MNNGRGKKAKKLDIAFGNELSALSSATAADKDSQVANPQSRWMRKLSSENTNLSLFAHSTPYDTEKAHVSDSGVDAEAVETDAASPMRFEDRETIEKEVVDSQILSVERDLRLNDLREAHRMLSEQSVLINRLMARAAVIKGADGQEVASLRKQLREVQAQRLQIETEIQDVTKALKTLQRRQVDSSLKNKNEPAGLIKVRHPNRDFFLADMFDYALKDDGASMEAPIFTLSTKPDLSIWEWRSKDGSKYIKVAPSVLGRATQTDKDVLIYVVSQLVEGLNKERDDARNRTVRFTVYDFLVTTNRQTSGQGYKLLQEAFERLRGTSITTDIRTGGERIKQGFGIIDEWRIIEKSSTDERMVAVEVTISRWLHNAVQAFEVLTIHPDYFRLRKPLARRLYEIARKHCGHQTQWVIGLELLRDKSGSKSTLREFRRAVREISADSSLPEYRIVLGEDDRVTFYTRNSKRLIRDIAKRL